MGRTRYPTGHEGLRPDHGQGETGEREETGEAEDGKGEKKLDLSLSQVAAAGAATLTAATAASTLNVYGTVIGAAVMAVLSTAASPLLSHLFSRSGEQAKHLAERAVAPKGRDTDKAATATGTQHTDPGAEATRTMAMPVLGPDATRAVPEERDGATADGHGGAVDPEETVLLPAQAPADQDATRRIPVPGDQDGTEGAGDGAGGEEEAPRRRGWRALLIPAALVFVAVMLLILVFELFTGRSLTSWTRGLDGPTSPSILGGNSAPPAQEEESEPEPEAPAVEEPPAQEPGTTEQQPTREPEQDRPAEPGTGQPESGGGGTGDEGGQQPPDRGGQETGPPVDEEPAEEPGGPVPQPGDPGGTGQNEQAPDQQQ